MVLTALGPLEGSRLDPFSEPAASLAFRRFYDAEFRGVYAYLYAMTGDRWVAEDLAQEAFTRAYRDWGAVSSYERPGAWVRTVAHNLSASRFRRLASETKAMLRLRGMRQPDAPEPEGEDAAFWAAVRSLPERQAQALVLHYVEDLPISEIAAIMGTAEGTARANLHRGRKSLAARLGVDTDGGDR